MCKKHEIYVSLGTPDQDACAQNSEISSFFIVTIMSMKSVAKLLIKHDNEFLMMHRSEHPTFGVDPDLPGGTMEESETAIQTMLREVEEEIGLVIAPDQVTEIFSGTDYSKHGTHYSLFITEVQARPQIQMSWEHSSCEWLEKSDFINKALSANDTYMHMVGETLALHFES